MGRPIKIMVFNYFTYDGDTNESTCKSCSCKIKGKHGTNLKKHLSSHPDLYEEMLSKELVKKTSIPKNMAIVNAHKRLFQFLTPDVTVKIDMDTVISACVELVTVNGRPYSALNDTGFRKIIDPILNGLNRKIAINSDSIKKYVHKESLCLQQQIINEVQSTLISLKLDAVTRLNRSFLGINLQYVLDDQIKLRTLGLIELTESHTGLYLKDTIINVLKKYKIESDQIYTVTSDNGANMIKAVNLIEKEILDSQPHNCNSEYDNNLEDNDNYVLGCTSSDSSECSDSSNENETDTINNRVKLNDEQINDLITEGNPSDEYDKTESILDDIQSFKNIGDSSIFTGLRCVAHTLQLAVIDSLKDTSVDKLLNKVRLLVKKLHNQTYIYLIKKENLKLPILDCLTRWHSTLDMLERIIYLKQFVQNMADNDSALKRLCLNNMEWRQIGDISKALSPSKMCTKKFQSEQLTMTDFYGAWILCKIQTKKLNTPFSKKIVECLINREKSIMNNKVLLAAIFLDPRYKIVLSNEQCTDAINHLISVWIHLKNLIEKKNIESSSISYEKTANIDVENDLNIESDGLENFLKEKEIAEETSFTSNSSKSSETKIETILKSYHIEQKRLNHKLDILKFWKSNEVAHPEISFLAKIIFAVPSTQVSVERLFSGLKFILSPYRSNINSKNLENQLLVRTNRLFEKVDMTKNANSDQTSQSTLSTASHKRGSCQKEGPSTKK